MGLFGKKKKKKQDDDLDAAAEAAEDALDEDVEDEDVVEDEPKPKSKSKSKSGDDAAKQFLIDHCEKIALALVILLAGWIVYSPFGRLQPNPAHRVDALVSNVRNVEQQIETNPIEDIEVADLPGDVEKQRRPIEATMYPMTPFYQAVVPQKKRGDPEYLPAIDLVADADITLFFVQEFSFSGRPVRKPKLDPKQRDWLERKKDRIEKAQKAIRDEKEKEIKDWYNGERKKIQKLDLDKDVRTERLDQLAKERDQKLKALDGDGSDLKVEKTIALDDFDFGGVRLPVADDAKREAPAFKAEAIPFVVAKALLPFTEQQQRYDQAFQTAYHANSNRDRPLYIEGSLQRLEVPPGADPAELDWSKSELISYGEVRSWNDPASEAARKAGKLSFVDKWVLAADEVVDERYVHDDRERWSRGGRLTKMLGPRVFDSWLTGGLATHPAVPLAGKRKTDGEEPAAAPVNPQPAVPVKPQAKPQPAAPFDDNFVFDDEEEDDPSSASDAGEELEELDQTEEDDETEPAEEVEEEVRHRLVRIFDYGVEPGKRYAYRVRLALRNPNSRDFKDIKDENVEFPGKREKWYYSTPWSEPSAPVLVPTGEKLIVQGYLDVIPSIREEEIQVLVQAYDLGANELAEMSMQLRRGELASDQGPLYTIDPVARRATRFPGNDKLQGQLVTALTVLDLRGGETIWGQIPGPVTCLYCDEDGNLFVRSTEDDRAARTRFTTLENRFQREAATIEEDVEEGGDGIDDLERELRALEN